MPLFQKPTLVTLLCLTLFVAPNSRAALSIAPTEKNVSRLLKKESLAPEEVEVLITYLNQSTGGESRLDHANRVKALGDELAETEKALKSTEQDQRKVADTYTERDAKYLALPNSERLAYWKLVDLEEWHAGFYRTLKLSSPGGLNMENFERDFGQGVFTADVDIRNRAHATIDYYEAGKDTPTKFYSANLERLFGLPPDSFSNADRPRILSFLISHAVKTQMARNKAIPELKAKVQSLKTSLKEINKTPKKAAFDLSVIDRVKSHVASVRAQCEAYLDRIKAGTPVAATN